VTLITLNEEEKIRNALQSVAWAEEIIVVDSGSTDQTVAIAKEMGARVIHNPWPGYGQQKNLAQQQASNDWVLNIDADEVISPELAQEIQQMLQDVHEGKLDAKGFYLSRKTFYLGRWIEHGGWYPNYLIRLSHRQFSKWTEPHVHEALKVDGPVGYLKHPIFHYAFSNIQEQILTNLRFSRLGAFDLIRTGKRPSLIKLLLKPIGKFLETYLLKRGFMDGLPGFIISINAAHSMFLKYAYLMEANIQRENLDH
jgi:glycosyltransferase involved in cell wall biosynthesis